MYLPWRVTTPHGEERFAISSDAMSFIERYLTRAHNQDKDPGEIILKHKSKKVEFTIFTRVNYTVRLNKRG